MHPDRFGSVRTHRLTADNQTQSLYYAPAPRFGSHEVFPEHKQRYVESIEHCVAHLMGNRVDELT